MPVFTRYAASLPAATLLSLCCSTLLVYNSTIANVEWPVIDMVSCGVQPATASIAAAYLRQP